VQETRKGSVKMALSQSTKRLEPEESLEQRLRAHREEVARLREEFGDPQVALFAFTRDRLDRESLLEGVRPNGDSQATDWDDDDDLDA
jgi:hypothetical protein